MNEREVTQYLQRQFGLTDAQWEEIKQQAVMAARSAKIYYDTLLDQGFTQEQSLHIVLVHGCAPKWPWTNRGTAAEE